MIKFHMTTNIPSVKYVSKLSTNLKKEIRDFNRGAIKVFLKTILRPVDEGGLPSLRSRARASFHSIAKEFGIGHAGPYTPSPYYPYLFNTAYSEGRANPVTWNNALAKPKAVVDFELSIEAINDGFDYFNFNDQYGADYPKSQIDMPWQLTDQAEEALREHFDANFENSISRVFKEFELETSVEAEY